MVSVPGLKGLWKGVSTCCLWFIKKCLGLWAMEVVLFMICCCLGSELVLFMLYGEEERHVWFIIFTCCVCIAVTL